jgi:hypothetical protein
VAWAEDSPAGSSANLIDDRMREMKIQMREVIAVDHIMSSSGSGATWGFHNKVTFYNQASDPSVVADSFILFAKDASSKSELHMIDEDGNTLQLTSAGKWVGGMQYEVRMWSGLTSAIPSGWVICDGNNSTPNLTDKFIRGTATISARTFTGAGADTHTHTINNHTHSTSMAHTHDYSRTTSTYNPEFNAAGDGSTSSPAHSHTYFGTTGGASTEAFTSGNPSDRGMDTISNVPAYIPLAFIMHS